MKRLISIFLAVMLVLNGMPMEALAAEDSVSATQESALSETTNIDEEVQHREPSGTTSTNDGTQEGESSDTTNTNDETQESESIGTTSTNDETQESESSDTAVTDDETQESELSSTMEESAVAEERETEATETEVIEVDADTSVPSISEGTVTGKIYEWKLNDGNVETSGKETLDYTDTYAEIRVALGAGDSFADNSIHFSDAGCKETTTSGMANAEETNRYILIRPGYYGTIHMTAAFSGASNGKKGRVYCIDHGEAAISDVALSGLDKETGGLHQLGSDFASSASQNLSFAVEPSHVYSLYTYNAGSVISALSYEYENESAISGSVDGETYSWSFVDKSVESGKTETVNYKDDDAAIRVGLGSGDSFAENGIVFSDSSCKESDSAKISNRYILIRPEYSATVYGTVKFTNATSSKKGRIYYVDHGETALSNADISKLDKGNTGNLDRVQLGIDFTSTTEQSFSFEVIAGHVYSLYTYNAASVISELSMEKSLLSGSEENGIYIWKFSKDIDVITDGETKNFQYSDAYASIRVGLGSGDSVADSSIQFSDVSCKDEDGKCPGYENVSKTNRYILIKPEQAGTIRFLAQFGSLPSGRNGRIYYIDHGETEISEISLTDLKKANGTALGEDFSSTAQKECSLDVHAGHVYSIYIYQYQGYGATVSGLSMEKSLISGSVSEDVYTWEFGNVILGSDETKTFGYGDDHAVISVGLGNGDSFADNSIRFSDTSCKDEDGKCPGYENVSKTNRYILIKPEQAGTIRFSVQFAQGVTSSQKGRVYYIDHGEKEISEVTLTDIKKEGGTNLGADFTSTTKEERSFAVQAGHVYSIYTYQYQGYGATISGLCMVESAAISGNLDEDTYIYTWKFEDEQISSGETKTFRYSDKYAAIGVGLGSEDSFTDNKIVFSDSSCKTSAKDTNRYITITPEQAGTIDFKVQFANGVSSSNKGYIYYIDHGKTELSKIDLSALNQNGKTDQLGDVFTTTTEQALSLPVKAGRTYSLYIYNEGSQGVTFSELKYVIETVNIIQNQQYKEDFEEGIDPEKWTTTGTVTIAGDAQGGEKCIQLGRNATASTTITGIPQGSYTVAMWVKGSSSSKPKMTLSGTGGPDSYLKLNPALKNAANGWIQAAHRNVLVYNGQMTLTISADQGLYVDTIQISLDSEDGNTIQNWDFESGMTNWSTKGTAELITDGVDAGMKAVRLADQSEISQTVTVKPDTDYIVTARMKVDRQDTYKSTTQYHPDDGTTILGFLVERTSLGNRVNLGVRGGSTVLRQAPAGTTDYALVTVAFHTGADQTEVEIYANTIFDQNYKDSVTIYENTFGTENTYPGGWQRPNPDKTDTTKLADNWQSNGGNYAYIDNFDIFEVNNDYTALYNFFLISHIYE